MKKYGLLSFIMIFVLSISLIGCNSDNKPSKEDSSSKLKNTLTIGVMPDLDSVPFIIAQHNGYFEEEGIKVDIQHFKSAMDRDAAIQADKLDGAVSDMLPVVFLNDSEIHVKITSKTDSSFKLIAGKNSKIEKLDGIKGKSIGISKNTIIDYLTDKILESSNADPSSNKKIAIPKIPSRLEMLKNNKLDMATLPEPLATVATLSGGKVLSSSETLGINPGVMIFTQKSIDSKKEEIKALYRAYNKAVDYVKNEDKEKYIDIIIKEAGFPEAVKDSIKMPNYTKASMASEKEFNEVLNWLKANKLTSSNFKLEDVSDSSLIE